MGVNEYYITLEEKPLFATNFLELQNVVCVIEKQLKMTFFNYTHHFLVAKIDCK
jgi:hypothetical protein